MSIALPRSVIFFGKLIKRKIISKQAKEAIKKILGGG
jgi:hypothetical protein